MRSHSVRWDGISSESWRAPPSLQVPPPPPPSAVGGQHSRLAGCWVERLQGWALAFCTSTVLYPRPPTVNLGFSAPSAGALLFALAGRGDSGPGKVLQTSRVGKPHLQQLHLLRSHRTRLQRPHGALPTVATLLPPSSSFLLPSPGPKHHPWSPQKKAHRITISRDLWILLELFRNEIILVESDQLFGGDEKRRGSLSSLPHSLLPFRVYFGRGPELNIGMQSSLRPGSYL